MSQGDFYLPAKTAAVPTFNGKDAGAPGLPMTGGPSPLAASTPHCYFSGAAASFIRKRLGAALLTLSSMASISLA